MSGRQPQRPCESSFLASASLSPTFVAYATKGCTGRDAAPSRGDRRTTKDGRELRQSLTFREIMNSSLRLRLLTRADLPFADSVRALARWNQTLDDWQRFLATEPEGCFLAEWNGARAGAATTRGYGPD